MNEPPRPKPPCLPILPYCALSVLLLRRAHVLGSGLVHKVHGLVTAALDPISKICHLGFEEFYTPVHCIIIVLKNTTSYRVAKRITPSLSLLKGPSLKIRKRTTLTQRFSKLFMAVLTFLREWITIDNRLPGAKLSVLSIVKIRVPQFNCDVVQLELFLTRLFKSTY